MKNVQLTKKDKFLAIALGAAVYLWIASIMVYILFWG